VLACVERVESPPNKPLSRRAPQRRSRLMAKDVERNSPGAVSRHSRKPPIDILGAHRVPVTEELVLRMLKAHWGGRVTPRRREQAMPRVTAELGGLVLVEALLSAACIRELVLETRDAGSQVPWQVTLLTADGEQVVRPLFLDEPDAFPARVTFFLHYFDRESLLVGRTGSVPLPRLRRMPRRLASLITYRPVD
jgi:hypothetical protein